MSGQGKGKKFEWKTDVREEFDRKLMSFNVRIK